MALFDFERVVVRRLILFVRRGKKIWPLFGVPEVEVDRKFFTALVIGCRSNGMCLDCIPSLVAGNCHFVSARFTKAGKNNLYPNQAGGQRYRLQGPGCWPRSVPASQRLTVSKHSSHADFRRSLAHSTAIDQREGHNGYETCSSGQCENQLFAAGVDLLAKCL